MTAAIATPINHIKLTPGSAMIISGLTWKTYEALLQDLGDNRPTRIAYDQGVLEIRMPGELHEIVNRLLAKIITMLAMELGMEANDFGSTTLNREIVDRGIEPDSCFYIQNAIGGQGMETKASESLAPDLALEVDIASSSASKMSIYLAIEVPEIWLYRRHKLSIQLIQNGQYINAVNSRAFPMVNVNQLNQWIEQRKTETDLTVLREVQRFGREYIRYF
ncbi:Uma2 family endonuclease [Tychonema sp. BBK16]|uniref:Uma2 family endonuclease n=1 Tax=Tychonema sp. BBK16 TaxID=2699888 RepID=UPI001F33EDD0|nr:Uma2 family endonuclease [Tychonema sp. BBK16]MCF6374093.1 Uma2 family endonuclease [Tychonema sp. BBK16]